MEDKFEKIKEIVESVDYGKVEIIVQNNEPVRVDVKKQIKLTERVDNIR